MTRVIDAEPAALAARELPTALGAAKVGWSGKFVDPQLEAEFGRDSVEALRRFLRFSVVLASLTFLAYGLHDALLVPDAAIGTEQARKYVMVVGADNTATTKYVILGQTTPDGLRVIKSGLGADDRVIVNGLMRARPGQKVTPQEAGAKPAAAAPAGAAPQKPK